MKLAQHAAIGVLSVIPVGALLLMFEVVEVSHSAGLWFVRGYLVLVLVLLTRAILLDALGIRKGERDDEPT